MIALPKRVGIGAVGAQVQTGARTLFIDNLRVYLTLLVIFHHAAIAYGGAGDWGVKDRVTDEISPILLSLFNGVNQAYFMATFFLLAGYFTPVAFDRKGTRQFLTDRLIRLGIPLLIYTTVIVNLNGFLLDRFYFGEPYQLRIGYTPGHLWFLQALLLFALIYACFRTLTGARATSRPAAVRPFPSEWILWAMIALLALLTFSVRVWFPVGVWVGGLQLGHFVHYLFAFWVGILAYRYDWFTQLPPPQARRWGIGVLLGIPAFLLVGLAAGVLSDPAALDLMMGGAHWQALLYALWESFFLIAAMIFLIHLFRSRFNQAGPWLRWLAANVYTVYIIHQTVLYGVNIALLSVAIPSIGKFFLAALITIAICFPLSALLRKVPGAGRVLG